MAQPFGRILVRVVRQDPDGRFGSEVFQQLCSPEERVYPVLFRAYAQFVRSNAEQMQLRPVRELHDVKRQMVKLTYHANRPLRDEPHCETVGDLVSLPGQHTLGTITLALRV